MSKPVPFVLRKGNLKVVCIMYLFIFSSFALWSTLVVEMPHFVQVVLDTQNKLSHNMHSEIKEQLQQCYSYSETYLLTTQAQIYYFAASTFILTWQTAYNEIKLCL